MSYFVVERSGDSGGLRIPLPTAYETREAAIAALSAATASGEVTLAGEVFIADLGSAVPVLVMAAAAPPAPVAAPVEESMPEVPEDEITVADESAESVEAASEPEEASSDAAEAEPGDFILEETAPTDLDPESADDVYTSWETVPDVAPGGTTLADALKRAATTLEGEGVVAPESVVSEADDVSEDAGAVLDLDEELGEPPVAEAADDEAESEWPWANIESYEVSAEPVEDTDDAALAPVVAESAGAEPSEPDIEALVESLGDDAPIITSAPPEGEEAYMPHPVILGDYGDVPVDNEALAEEEALAEDVVTAADEGPEVLDSAEEEAAPSEEAEETADDVEVAETDGPAVALDGGYAPAGDLDLGEYTCQDCVYSNTCPKVGQVTPAECGSFQWKSE